MVRPTLEPERGPPMQAVLDALDDPACREIVQALDEPKTASELSDECDIPLSTTYRKLDLLTEASLLEEQTEIRSDGHHTTRYVLGVESVELALTENGEFEVEIVRPPRSAEERLAHLWSEVQKET